MARVRSVLPCLVIVGLAAYVWGKNCIAEEKRLSEECAGRLGCPAVWCDEDDFQAVQCVGNGCFCVTVDGLTIGNYTSERYNSGDCRCARDELAGNNFMACDETGNY